MKALTLSLFASFILLNGLRAQDRTVDLKIPHAPDREWTKYKRIAIAEFTGDDGVTITPRSQDISDYVADLFQGG